jgi:hypothetical protein
MKFGIFTIIFIFFSILFINPVYAIQDPLASDNNKFGIHIFDANEVERVPDLVNGNGGAWGYVTVPIRSDDRNREKWNKFMKRCGELKIIPIVRLATTMGSNYWTKPDQFDAIDFANFLNDLEWPTKNRYVIVYNEPNHENEWGGTLAPEEYADVLVETVKTFKERNDDFFMLPAGLDAAAPNGNGCLNWKTYLNRMYWHNPQAFQVIDGWTSHSYPNPAFSSSPYVRHDHSIISFIYENDYVSRLNGKQMPIFITETGWSNERLSDMTIAEFLKVAFSTVWNNSQIVAITPFVMEAADGPFKPFSFIENGKEKPQYSVFKEFAKIEGKPVMGNDKTESEKKVLGSETENMPSVSDAPKYFYDLTGLKKVLEWIK